MTKSKMMRFGVLVAALAAFAGPAIANAAASPVWQYGGESLEEGYAFISPTKTAYFEVVGPSGGREFTLGCKMKMEGVVDPDGKGDIDRVTDGNGHTSMLCDLAQSGLEQCAPPETVEAVNVPWETELISVGEQVRNVITMGTKTVRPGWKIACQQYGVVETLEEKCPFETYSVFSKNGAQGAELLYEPAFSQGRYCESNNGHFEGNTLKLSYLEVTPGYTVYP